MPLPACFCRGGNHSKRQSEDKRNRQHHRRRRRQQSLCLRRLRARGGKNKGVYLKSFETELSKLAEEKIREAFPQYTNVKLTTSLKAFRTLERINRALEKGKSLDELDLPFDFERRPSKPAPEHGHDKVQPRTENNAALI